MLLVMRRLVGGHHRVVPLGIRRFRRWQRQRSLRFKVSHADFGSRTGRFTAVAVGWLTVMVHNCNQSPGPGPQKGREMRWIRVDIIQEIIIKKEKKKRKRKTNKRDKISHHDIMTSTCGLTRQNRVELTRHRPFAFDTPRCMRVLISHSISNGCTECSGLHPTHAQTHTQESERMKEKAHTNPSAWHERL